MGRCPRCGAARAPEFYQLRRMPLVLAMRPETNDPLRLVGILEGLSHLTLVAVVVEEASGRYGQVLRIISKGDVVDLLVAFPRELHTIVDLDTIGFRDPVTVGLAVNRIHSISVPPVEAVVRVFRDTAVNLAIDASVVHYQMLRFVTIPVSARVVTNAHAAKLLLFVSEGEVRTNVLCKRSHDDVVVKINASNAAEHLLEVNRATGAAVVVILSAATNDLVALNAGPLVQRQVPIEVVATKHRIETDT